ncbi:MAG: hypothetical protein LQ350_000181 [Teloschistes chrysophthalmus]|nr:MAG: hypothetical protein LQ350_000181 [Niorma chrysophthalma]
MSINKGNVFSSKNLCEYMLSSLPKEASPHLRDSYDAVALLSHACMLTVGFRLEGLGEDHKNEEASSDSGDPQPLPPQWNITTTSNYAFRYAHAQSALHYILKVSRLGSKAIINALAIVPDADEKVYTLEIAVKDFLSPSNFPFNLPSLQNEASPTHSGQGDDEEGLQANQNKLSACFISAGRIADLGAMLKFQIIQKLAPSLHKEGYEESAHAASSTTPSQQQQQPPRQPPPERGDPRPAYDPLRDSDPTFPPSAQPHPFNDPLAEAPPRRPYPAGDFPPPGFEDEYEMNRPPHHMPGGLGGGGGRRPLNIGERDLYPPGMGPHDPLRGPGGGGFGGIGGGGMHPTFDDPLFGGNGGGGGGGGVGGYGGRAPPGARYDPVGPGDGPPDLRGGGRFPGGGGMGGRPPNPFGGFGGGDFI